MAFHLYEKTTTQGCEARTVPGVSVQRSGQTVFSIPRHVLTAAGLPDAVGAKLDALIGTGDDAGKIALVRGKSLSISCGGGSKHLVTIRMNLGKSHFPIKDVRAAQADSGALILSLPLDFPFDAPRIATETIVSARHASSNGQALAA